MEFSEEIYMRVPEGYNAADKVCKLEKALYGLVQAPLLWNKRLTDYLKDQSLEQLKSVSQL